MTMSWSSIRSTADVDDHELVVDPLDGAVIIDRLAADLSTRYARAEAYGQSRG
jgi:hypothetical protein